MAFKRTNRWDVQVAFENGAAFGIKSRSDVEQTPETVVEELEYFCRRVRTALERRATAVKATSQSSGRVRRERVAP